MKVIHVSPVYVPAWQYGGTVRAIHSMTTALVEQGHEVEVVTTTIGTSYGAGHEVHEGVVDDVRVTYVPGRLHWGGVVAPRLCGEVIRQATEDAAIHISSGWQPAFRRLFASLRGSARPYVYSPHGCFSPEVFARGKIKKGTYYWLFEQRNLQAASAVVATSEMEAVDLGRLGLSFPVSVVPNICDARLWKPAEAEGLEWRRSLAIADDDIVILQVCRPDPIKNTIFLIDAVRGIAADRTYVLVVMGPGQSRLPVQNPLPSHVRIIQHDGSSGISELRAAYTAAQFVAVPSLYECFGNVVLEAILCGTPVLAGPRVGAAYLPELAAAITILPLRVDAWTHAMRASPKGAKVSKDTIINAATAVAPSRVAKQLSDIYASICAYQSHRPLQSGSGPLQ